jgi:hypothetical protein
MKKYIYLFLSVTLITLTTGTFFYSCKPQKIVSLKTLLIEMTDRKSLTLYPSPWYKLKQAGSYDRKSDSTAGQGWFANDDYTQFIGIDTARGVKEYILLDAEGPGAIVRWWMTFSGPGSYDGKIRVYIDNAEKPVLEENVLKLLSGQLLAGAPLSSSVSPETDADKRGHNLYLPLPFSKHCRITYECDSIRISGGKAKPSIYYNICYREYEPNTKVISFSVNELKNSKELILKTNELLLSSDRDVSDKNVTAIYKDEVIPANDSLILNTETGGSAISRLALRVIASDTEYALRSVILKLVFDGIQTVWVPAGDFFGTAYKKTVYSTWNSSSDEDMKLESHWLMPFRKNCQVILINYGNQEVKVALEADLSKYKWLSNSMYFGAAWHEYHQISTAGSELTGGTGLHRDINFADIKGAGVYAGDAVTVYNTVDAWWGEGDEKIFVDDESFPSSIGTGTEDYYGYAWCRPELFSHPFIAQPSGSGNFHPGLTINMRYRALDAIPFKSSISSNIELWHWLPAVIDYALTSYWYVMPPYEVNIKPDTGMVRKALPKNLDLL